MNIGQASKTTGVSERMIRHYERVGLMPPPDRRDNGYRDYSPQSIERLRFIANARGLGFSLVAEPPRPTVPYPRRETEVLTER